MQDKITIADAPDCLNTNDKAMWVLGYQAALAARSTCLHQIQEPAPAQAAPAVAEKPDEAQIKALMRKHRIWIEHSTLFEDDEPPRELRAVQAEQHQFESFVRELIALAATPAADAPANVWQQVIDEELVSAHLGVANNNAMRDEAKWATHELICWHIDVATNPAVNGGKILAPVELLNRVLDSEAVEAMSDASDELRALLATATELPAQADTPDSFREWFAKNYPADTIIVDPDWHAKSIFRMAQAHARLAAPQAQADARDADVMYYLQDARWSAMVGNCPSFWRSGGGYTTSLDDAERFTLEAAMKQHKCRETDLPWLCSELDKLRRPTVDCQYMPRSWDAQRAAIAAQSAAKEGSQG
ncbi:hypothetical protein [Comamonas thiooxydans]|uniref:hypothetical protein n=1 Tax=Comamonas thiooxydans TaxID=363952 RepID=UPI00209C3AB4|nr:hypothetical protein [Comamonas thiooxydans]MCO8251154.1 hypothetical protein [Comamonas thiooxydans]